MQIHILQIRLIWPQSCLFCSKTANSNLRRECSERLKEIVVRRDELLEEEEGQEIRRRAAEQAEKWLGKLRGDLEEKKRERTGGEETKEREEWRRGIDFKEE